MAATERNTMANGTDSGSQRRTGTRFRSAPASRPPRTSPQTRGTRFAHRPGRPSPGSPYRQARRGPRPLVIGAIAALLVALVAGGVFLVPRFFSTSDAPAAGTAVTVEIPEGSGGDTIASLLSKAHVIEDPKAYYAAVDALGAEQSLQPGIYSFTVGQDAESIVRQLMAGPNADGTKLTIPEGLTVAQTASCVEEALGISADEFIAQAKASNYAADYTFLQWVANDSLEGFLCPKTYTFTGAPTADSVIRTLLDQYQVEYASLDFSSARATIQSRYGIEMSDYDFLIMASVIEREALNNEQRYLVSSTFYNRMKAGTPLQSDATMGYVTGGAVSADDLTTESPYNTYLNQGLPSTPICAPSLDSLEAALAPSDTSYLYFFITSDFVRFSETYEDHLAAIEEAKQ